MAHELAIAKASLLAALLRSDPTPLARDDIDTFHSSLHAATQRCSPGNIQICKAWLMLHVVHSSTRTGLLGRYVVALAKSFENEQQAGKGSRSLSTLQSSRRSSLSSRRKQLHLLYLLHDTLHHIKTYNRGRPPPFPSVIQPTISALLKYIAKCSPDRHRKIHKRLTDLCQIWEDQSIFSPDTVNAWRKTIEEAHQQSALAKTEQDVQDATEDKSVKSGPDTKSQWRNAPYVMPAMHGDPSAPYHELPAANLLPHITPNSLAPIQPSAVKPLQITPGPPDSSLVDAMTKFFRDVDRIYATDDPFSRDKVNGKEEEDDRVLDIDELGQVVLRDPATGEVVDGETYYGWSRGFCQNMTKRKAGHNTDPPGRNPGAQRGRLSRSRSFSSSSSASARSRSPPRPRDHHHHQRGRLRSPEKPRSRSRSRRRSRSRSVRRQTAQRRESYSSSRSRSPSRPQARSRSPSYSPDYEPPKEVSRLPAAAAPETSLQSHQQPYQQQQPPSAPQQPALQQPSVPMPPGGFSIPGLPAAIPPPGFIPPPPPNWNGPWPPPPPPLPLPFAMPPFPMAMNMSLNMAMNGSLAAPGALPGLGQQPPPPPQQQQQQGYQQQFQQQQYGEDRGAGAGYTPRTG